VKPGRTAYPDSLEASLIAPCGMDCGVCSAHLRDRNRCAGCGADDAQKVPHCTTCAIRVCDRRATAPAGYCSECEAFPCRRLKQMDVRYRTKYGMSVIGNLERIRDDGLEAFVESERERWTCPGCGAVICVHKPLCIYCGRARSGA
jgi:hypothetical protein